MRDQMHTSPPERGVVRGVVGMYQALRERRTFFPTQGVRISCLATILTGGPP